MDQILEKVMNFINENTMLLIVICIFLIVILIIYLIDNTIKTKRLEKEELLKKENPGEPTIVANPIPGQAEEAPVVEPVVEKPVEEVVTPEVSIEPVVEETPVTEPVVEKPVEEVVTPEVSVEPVVEETPVVEPVIEEAPKSKYTNDKKLSDIFGKREEDASKKIETTQEFSDELDRILQKLNNEETTNEDETTDYTNMF